MAQRHSTVPDGEVGSIARMGLGVIVAVADVGLEVGDDGAAHGAGLGAALNGAHSHSAPAAPLAAGAK